MKTNTILLAALAAAMCLALRCTPVDSTDTGENSDSQDIPTDPYKESKDSTGTKQELTTPIPWNENYKVATLWIDLEANIKKLSKKADALKYLDKIQDAGFNAIVLDIKGVAGYVMYDSAFLTKYTTVSGVNIANLDYDYVPFFVEECHKRNMRITLSTCVMTMGHNDRAGDPCHADPYWDDMYSVEYLPGKGLVDIREDTQSDIFSFLQPSRLEVHNYAVRLASEVVTKFDCDGYILDYCRYQNYNSDFSDNARMSFEDFLGHKVENWPDDIYTYSSADCDRNGFTPGQYYNQWCEYKSTVIKSYVTDMRAAVKAANPDCDIEYWAGAWWPLPGTGQNWASAAKDKTSGYWWGTSTYYKTGFADQLDIFQLGAYTSTVYGSGTESIQGLINQGRSLIRNECQMYGTISACVNSQFEMKDACYMCMAHTDGLMVFDLSHVVSGNWWAKCKQGIMKYRNEYENK